MKNTHLVLIFSLLLTMQGFAQKRVINTKVKLEGTEFYLRNVEARRYIDIPGYGSNAQTKNGANVQLWDKDDGADRKLKFISAGKGYYYIEFQHNKAQLDVHGCFRGKLFCGTYKYEKGANVQIWAAGTSEAHQWKLEEFYPGQFKIINRYSGKVLDASKSNIKKNGCNVQQWDWKNGKNQLWELIDVKTGAHYYAPK